MSHGGPFSHTKFRFNLPSYEDSKNRRREMVRFGYRKVSVVAPWKVEERGQVRGKEAGYYILKLEFCLMGWDTISSNSQYHTYLESLG